MRYWIAYQKVFGLQKFLGAEKGASFAPIYKG